MPRVVEIPGVGVAQFPDDVPDEEIVRSIEELKAKPISEDQSLEAYPFEAFGKPYYPADPASYMQPEPRSSLSPYSPGAIIPQFDRPPTPPNDLISMMGQPMPPPLPAPEPTGDVLRPAPITPFTKDIARLWGGPAELTYEEREKLAAQGYPTPDYPKSFLQNPGLQLGPQAPPVSEEPVRDWESLMYRAMSPLASTVLGEDQTAQVYREGWNLAKGLPEFMMSRMGVASLGAGMVAPKLVSAYFTGDMALAAAEQSDYLLENWNEMAPTDRTQALMQTGFSGGLALWLGKHTLRQKPPPPPARLGEPMEKGDVGIMPEEEAYAISVVMDQHPEIRKLRFLTEEELAANPGRYHVGQWAVPDRTTGEIVIIPSGFSRYVRNLNLPTGKWPAEIYRMLKEEDFHHDVYDIFKSDKDADEVAERYFNNLSKAEQDREVELYLGTTDRSGFTASQLGHEILRRHLEKLAGMEPREYQDMGLWEGLNSKRAMLLQRVVRFINERIHKTDASLDNKRIIEAIDANLEASRVRAAEARAKRESTQPLKPPTETEPFGTARPPSGTGKDRRKLPPPRLGPPAIPATGSGTKWISPKGEIIDVVGHEDGAREILRKVMSPEEYLKLDDADLYGKMYEMGYHRAALDRGSRTLYISHPSGQIAKSVRDAAEKWGIEREVNVGTDFYAVSDIKGKDFKIYQVPEPPEAQPPSGTVRRTPHPEEGGEPRKEGEPYQPEFFLGAIRAKPGLKAAEAAANPKDQPWWIVPPIPKALSDKVKLGWKQRPEKKQAQTSDFEQQRLKDMGFDESLIDDLADGIYYYAYTPLSKWNLPSTARYELLKWFHEQRGTPWSRESITRRTISALENEAKVLQEALKEHNEFFGKLKDAKWPMGNWPNTERQRLEASLQSAVDGISDMQRNLRELRRQGATDAGNLEFDMPAGTTRAKIAERFSDSLMEMRTRGLRRKSFSANERGYVITYSNTSGWYQSGQPVLKGEQVNLDTNQFFVPGNLQTASLIAENFPDYTAFENAHIRRTLYDITREKEGVTLPESNWRKMLPDVTQEVSRFLDKISGPQLTFDQKLRLRRLVDQRARFISNRMDPNKPDIPNLYYEKRIAALDKQIDAIQSKAKPIDPTAPAGTSRLSYKEWSRQIEELDDKLTDVTEKHGKAAFQFPAPEEVQKARDALSEVWRAYPDFVRIRLVSGGVGHPRIGPGLGPQGTTRRPPDYSEKPVSDLDVDKFINDAFLYMQDLRKRGANKQEVDVEAEKLLGWIMEYNEALNERALKLDPEAMEEGHARFETLRRKGFQILEWLEEGDQTAFPAGSTRRPNYPTRVESNTDIHDAIKAGFDYISAIHRAGEPKLKIKTEVDVLRDYIGEMIGQLEIAIESESQYPKELVAQFRMEAYHLAFRRQQLTDWFNGLDQESFPSGTSRRQEIPETAFAMFRPRPRVRPRVEPRVEPGVPPAVAPGEQAGLPPAEFAPPPPAGTYRDRPRVPDLERLPETTEEMKEVVERAFAYIKEKEAAGGSNLEIDTEVHRLHKYALSSLEAIKVVLESPSAAFLPETAAKAKFTRDFRATVSLGSESKDNLVLAGNKLAQRTIEILDWWEDMNAKKGRVASQDYIRPAGTGRLSYSEWLRRNIEIQNEFREIIDKYGFGKSQWPESVKRRERKLVAEYSKLNNDHPDFNKLGPLYTPTEGSPRIGPGLGPQGTTRRGPPDYTYQPESLEDIAKTFVKGFTYITHLDREKKASNLEIDTEVIDLLKYLGKSNIMLGRLMQNRSLIEAAPEAPTLRTLVKDKEYLQRYSDDVLRQAIRNNIERGSTTVDWWQARNERLGRSGKIPDYLGPAGTRRLSYREWQKKTLELDDKLFAIHERYGLAPFRGPMPRDLVKAIDEMMALYRDYPDFLKLNLTFGEGSPRMGPGLAPMGTSKRRGMSKRGEDAAKLQAMRIAALEGKMIPAEAAPTLAEQAFTPLTPEAATKFVADYIAGFPIKEKERPPAKFKKGKGLFPEYDVSQKAPLSTITFEDFAGRFRAKFGPVPDSQLRDVFWSSAMDELGKLPVERVAALVKDLKLTKQLVGSTGGEARLAKMSKPRVTPSGEVPKTIPGEKGQMALPTLQPSLDLMQAIKRGKGIVAPREAQAGMRLYYRAINAIAHKLMQQSEETRKPVARKVVEPDEIASPITSKSPVYMEIRDPNIANLGDILTADSRVEGRNVEDSRRLVALVSKDSGRVTLASVWDTGKKGVGVVVSLTGQGRTPLSAILKSHRPVYSVLLDEPVRYLRMQFDNIRDYNRRWGNEARARSQVFEPEYYPREGTEMGLEKQKQMGLSEELEVVPGSRTALPGELIPGRGVIRPSGGFMGPQSQQARMQAGLVPGEIGAERVVTDAEARSLYEYARQAVDWASPDDFKAMVRGLEAEAQGRTISQQRLPVITALNKMYRSILERSEDMTPGKAMERLANELHELVRVGWGEQHFVGRVLGKYGGEIPTVGRPVRPSPTTRELETLGPGEPYRPGILTRRKIYSEPMPQPERRELSEAATKARARKTARMNVETESAFNKYYVPLERQIREEMAARRRTTGKGTVFTSEEFARQVKDYSRAQQEAARLQRTTYQEPPGEHVPLGEDITRIITDTRSTEQRIRADENARRLASRADDWIQQSYNAEWLAGEARAAAESARKSGKTKEAERKTRRAEYWDREADRARSLYAEGQAAQRRISGGPAGTTRRKLNAEELRLANERADQAVADLVYRYAINPSKGFSEWYSGWLTQNLRREGGEYANMAADIGDVAIDRTKAIYGELAPTLNKALVLAGGTKEFPLVQQLPTPNQLRTTLWLNKLQVLPDGQTATSRAVDAIEGRVEIPKYAQETIDAAFNANYLIGDLLMDHPTGGFQRNLTAWGYDIFVRGGELFDTYVKANAKLNASPEAHVAAQPGAVGTVIRQADPALARRVITLSGDIAKIEAEMRAAWQEWRNEVLSQTPDVNKIEKINQDFRRRWPRTVTHIKTPYGWQPLFHTDLHNYLRNAALRASHVAAFREQFPNNEFGREKLRVLDERLRGWKNPETGEMMQGDLSPERLQDWDALVKILQGRPPDTYNRFGILAPGRSYAEFFRALNDTAFSLARRGVLTGQLVTQTPETLTSPLIFFSPQTFLRTLVRFRELYPTMEITGQINKLLYDFSLEPQNPIRTAFRLAGNTISKAFFENFLNEFQGKWFAAQATVAVERLMQGKMSRREIESLKQTMRAEGFTKEQVDKMIAGDEELLWQFKRRTPTWAVGENKIAAEGSRFGANRLYNSILRFQLYPMTKMNQLKSIMERVIETNESGTKAEKLAARTMLAKFVGLTTFQGALLGVMYAYFTGGKEAASMKLKEAKDEPLRFLIESFLGSMSGPLYLVYSGARWGGWAGIGEQFMRLAFPFSVTANFIEAAGGMGQYKDLDTFDRMAKFLEQKTPGFRMLRSTFAEWALGQESRKLEANIKALNQWKRDRWKREEFPGGPAHNREFRMHMKKAFQAIIDEDIDARFEHLMAAAGVKYEQGMNANEVNEAIASSLRQRRLLVNPDTREDLSAEETDDLIRRVGDDAYWRMNAFDEMLKEAARDRF